MDDASIQTLFLTLDTNQDGEISLDEFTAGWAKFQAVQSGQAEGGGPAEVPFGERQAYLCHSLRSLPRPRAAVSFLTWILLVFRQPA